MSGTREGGLKTAAKMRQKYGVNIFQVIGRAGGYKSRGGGFGYAGVGKDGLTGRARAAVAGKKGGQISRRRPADEWSEYID